VLVDNAARLYNFPRDVDAANSLKTEATR